MREWLKELRNDKRIKQSEIADCLGISQAYYNLIENGERQKTLDLSTAQKLALVFGVSVDWIIEQEKKTA